MSLAPRLVFAVDGKGGTSIDLAEQAKRGETRFLSRRTFVEGAFFKGVLGGRSLQSQTDLSAYYFGEEELELAQICLRKLFQYQNANGLKPAIGLVGFSFGGWAIEQIAQSNLQIPIDFAFFDDPVRKKGSGKIRVSANVRRAIGVRQQAILTWAHGVEIEAVSSQTSIQNGVIDWANHDNISGKPQVIEGIRSLVNTMAPEKRASQQILSLENDRARLGTLKRNRNLELQNYRRILDRYEAEENKELSAVQREYDRIYKDKKFFYEMRNIHRNLPQRIAGDMVLQGITPRLQGKANDIRAHFDYLRLATRSHLDDLNQSIARLENQIKSLETEARSSPQQIVNIVDRFSDTSANPYCSP